MLTSPTSLPSLSFSFVCLFSLIPSPLLSVSAIRLAFHVIPRSANKPFFCLFSPSLLHSLILLLLMCPLKLFISFSPAAVLINVYRTICAQVPECSPHSDALNAGVAKAETSAWNWKVYQEPFQSERMPMHLKVNHGPEKDRTSDIKNMTLLLLHAK